MKCFNHPEAEARATCSECGKAICSDCAINVEDKMKCRDCLAAGRVSLAAPGPTVPTNKMALTSMILGLAGWLVWLINMCLGLVLFAVTLGFGMICLIPLGILPYFGWVPAVITGHKALKELEQEGNVEQGRGMALVGLISGYIPIGFFILSTVLIIILAILSAVAGVSIPIIDELMRQFG